MFCQSQSGEYGHYCHDGAFTGAAQGGVFTEFVIDHADQLVVEFQRDLDRCGAVHFECGFDHVCDAVSHQLSHFGDPFADNLHAVHSVHAVVGCAIVSAAVHNKVTVVLIEHQRHRLHNILVTVLAIDLFIVLI